jgi:hypothetical protein
MNVLHCVTSSRKLATELGLERVARVVVNY